MDIKGKSGQSPWEVSHKLSPGRWAGPETPLFPRQLPGCTRLFATWGMKLKSINSIYCICLSFLRQLKLDAFYLSTFDLTEEKITHGPDPASQALLLCESLRIFSANYLKCCWLPCCFSAAPLRVQPSRSNSGFVKYLSRLWLLQRFCSRPELRGTR